jgi:hypothetical protein
MNRPKLFLPNEHCNVKRNGFTTNICNIKIIDSQLKRRKVSFQKLINVHGYQHDWEMEAYKWAVSTGEKFYNGGVNHRTWLHGGSGHSHPVHGWGDKEGFTSWHFETMNIYSYLSSMFVRAIVDTSCPDHVKEWREHERVGLSKSRMLLVPTEYTSFGSPNFRDLFQFVGTIMKNSINYVRYAPCILDIKIYVSTYEKPHWCLELETGQTDDKINKSLGKLYSSWKDVVLRCESYNDLLLYGVHKLQKMTGCYPDLRKKRWWGKCDRSHQIKGMNNAK